VEQRSEHVEVDPLYEVMVKARLARRAVVFLLAASRDGDDDRGLAGRLLPESSGDLVAVHEGEDDVEEDEFRLKVCCGLFPDCPPDCIRNAA
jgi:hypothetical protein